MTLIVTGAKDGDTTNRATLTDEDHIGSQVGEEWKASEALTCSACDREVPRSETVRTETDGDLDPEKWQSLCCPDRGRKPKTVFVADEQ